MEFSSAVSNDGVDAFVLYRMVPPGRHYYVFSVNSSIEVADLQPKEVWARRLHLQFENDEAPKVGCHSVMDEYM